MKYFGFLVDTPLLSLKKSPSYSRKNCLTLIKYLIVYVLITRTTNRISPTGFRH